MRLIPLVGVDMFSYDELPQFFIHVTMPVGTKLETTDEVLSRIERSTRRLPAGEVRSVITKSGTMNDEGKIVFGSHLGEVVVELSRDEDKRRSMDEIIDELRRELASLPDVKRLEFVKMRSGPPTGKAVEVKVKGPEFSRLLEITAMVEKDLHRMPGVYDIGNDFLWGKNEIKIYVDNAKAALWGLDNYQIAHFIRTAFDGRVATVMRQDDEEIDVVVKLQEAYRRNITDLSQLQIINARGERVLLSEIAEIKIEPGVWKIIRFQRERVITVSAEVDKSVNSVVGVNQALKERFVNIARLYPGYKLDFRGEFDEFRTAFDSLKRLFVVGLILIYVILGAQFKSFAQPLVIMLTVPFAFIGAMLGLLVTGSPFSITTLYGIVGLAGIVVNDSIVLVDFINNARQEGAGKYASIMRAGQLRLQPILMTSVTTMLGLLPMAVGLGGGSAVWGPLATTIVWGLGVATVLTLFVIPAVYAIIDDWGQKLGITRFRES